MSSRRARAWSAGALVLAMGSSLAWGANQSPPSAQAKLCQVLYLRSLAIATTPEAPETGQTITFSVEPSSCDLEVSYDWDFDGDGQPDAQGPQAAHTFAQPGAHTVTLHVRDAAGGDVTLTHALELAGQIVPSEPETPPARWAFVSGGIGALAPLTLAKVGAGVPLSSWLSLAGSASFAATTLTRDGLPLALRAVAAGGQVLWRVVGDIHLGLGGGMLWLDGAYAVDWPLDSAREVRTQAPYVSASLGFQWGILMLSLELAYAL